MFWIISVFLYVKPILCEKELYTFSLSNLSIVQDDFTCLHFNAELQPKLKEDLKATLHLYCEELLAGIVYLNFAKDKIQPNETKTCVELPVTPLDYTQCILMLEEDSRINHWDKVFPSTIIADLEKHSLHKPTHEFLPMYKTDVVLGSSTVFSISSRVIPRKKYILSANHPCLVLTYISSMSVIENNTIHDMNDFHGFRIQGNKNECKSDIYRILLKDPITGEIAYNLMDVYLDADDLIIISLSIEKDDSQTDKISSDSSSKSVVSIKDKKIVKGEIKLSYGGTKNMEHRIPNDYKITLIDQNNKATFSPSSFNLGEMEHPIPQNKLKFEMEIKDTGNDEIVEIQPEIVQNEDYFNIGIKKQVPLKYKLPISEDDKVKNTFNCYVTHEIFVDSRFKIKCNPDNDGFNELIKMKPVFYDVKTQKKVNSVKLFHRDEFNSEDYKVVEFVIISKEEGVFKVRFQLDENQQNKESGQVSENNGLVFRVKIFEMITFTPSVDKIKLTNEHNTQTIVIYADKEVKEKIELYVEVINVYLYKVNYINIDNDTLVFGKGQYKTQEFSVSLNLDELERLDGHDLFFLIKLRAKKNHGYEGKMSLPSIIPLEGVFRSKNKVNEIKEAKEDPMKKDILSGNEVEHIDIKTVSNNQLQKVAPSKEVRGVTQVQVQMKSSDDKKGIIVVIMIILILGAFIYFKMKQSKPPGAIKFEQQRNNFY